MFLQVEKSVNLKTNNLELAIGKACKKSGCDLFVLVYELESLELEGHVWLEF